MERTRIRFRSTVSIEAIMITANMLLTPVGRFAR